MDPETKARLKKLTDALKRQKEVIAVYLFGSHARGTSTHKSDVDICVVLPENASSKSEAEIGSMYGEKMDVVLLKDLPLPLKFRVFREGKEIFVNDERAAARIRFQVIKEYLDYAPRLRKLTEAVLAAG